MKVITVATVLSLLFAVQSALAAEGKNVAANDDGMAIAEKILMHQDVETLPAKEEKVDQQKNKSDQEEPRGENAVQVADEDTNADISGTEGALEDSSSLFAKVLGDEGTQEDANKEGAAPGSLDYEMATVDLLADAPGTSLQEEKPANSLAKR